MPATCWWWTVDILQWKIMKDSKVSQLLSRRTSDIQFRICVWRTYRTPSPTASFQALSEVTPAKLTLCTWLRQKGKYSTYRTYIQDMFSNVCGKQWFPNRALWTPGGPTSHWFYVRETRCTIFYNLSPRTVNCVGAVSVCFDDWRTHPCTKRRRRWEVLKCPTHSAGLPPLRPPVPLSLQLSCMWRSSLLTVLQTEHKAALRYLYDTHHKRSLIKSHNIWRQWYSNTHSSVTNTTISFTHRCSNLHGHLSAHVDVGFCIRIVTLQSDK